MPLSKHPKSLGSWGRGQGCGSVLEARVLEEVLPLDRGAGREYWKWGIAGHCLWLGGVWGCWTWGEPPRDALDLAWSLICVSEW